MALVLDIRTEQRMETLIFFFHVQPVNKAVTTITVGIWLCSLIKKQKLWSSGALILKKKFESTTGVIIFSRGKFTESSRHLAAIALMQYHNNNMNITCVLAE